MMTSIDDDHPLDAAHRRPGSCAIMVMILRHDEDDRRRCGRSSAGSMGNSHRKDPQHQRQGSRWLSSIVTTTRADHVDDPDRSCRGSAPIVATITTDAGHVPDRS
jgi:hypothetical protein